MRADAAAADMICVLMVIGAMHLFFLPSLALGVAVVEEAMEARAEARVKYLKKKKSVRLALHPSSTYQ